MIFFYSQPITTQTHAICITFLDIKSLTCFSYMAVQLRKERFEKEGFLSERHF